MTKNQLSEDAEYILSKRPSRVVSLGAYIILLIFFIILLLASFISYPDTLKGTCKITTELPALKLIANQTGRIQNIFFENDEEVAKGDVIAVFENSISIKDGEHLKTFITRVDVFINTLTIDSLLNVEMQSPKEYGLLNIYYSDVVNTYKEVSEWNLNNDLNLKIEEIETGINDLNALLHLNNKNINLTKQRLEFAKYKYGTYEELFKKEAVSKLELVDYKEDKVGKEQMVNQLLEKKIHLVANLRKMTQLKDDVIKKHHSSVQKLLMKLKAKNETLRFELRKWETSYLIKSPVDGKVSFLKEVFINKSIKQDEKLFAVIPNNNEVVIKGWVKTTGYGKLNIGQKVKIYLDNYPYKEFGYLTGYLKSKGDIPISDDYYININLFEKKLLTSRKIEIPYSPEMKGDFEVITKNRSLFHRLFQRFYELQ